ncbi:M14 family zinc carboxypeptidase [Pseudothermotoga sp. U03pept]|uniref:M14 family zinc carboxypeptidase n=1 Tax=Pseudothermotoga sp. U03pept TaxID=3447012 RepID=UPI003F0A3F16
MDFHTLIEKIPNYQRFFYVDEFDERTDHLAKKYPKIVKVYQMGKSRKGHPIKVIQIGNGSKSALLFGCPHPNEPIGAMMLDFLAQELAENEALRSHFDYTWYLIKVIDPDGTKLNEGWFSNPQSIESYATNFYRPPGFKQVEWTFPVDYKTLHFHDPLPETQVLMKIIEEQKPAFMYSLHNAGFGGVYYYISENSPQLYKDFHQIPHSFNVPLALGEPEVPYLKMLSQAVYKLTPITEEYDYLEKNSKVDPAQIIKAGASSDEYASRVANTFSLVCEVPYYYDPRIEDSSQSSITRKEARMMAWESSTENAKIIQEIFERSRRFADENSPFFEVFANYVETVPKYLEAERNWIETDPELLRKATVAEVFDNTCVTQFYQSLSLGMLRRLLGEILAKRQDNQIEETREKLNDHFKKKIEYLKKNLNYKAIPIKDLVAIQLLAGLITADYVQRS